MQKEPLYYDPFIRELIFLLKFKNNIPQLKGSASYKDQEYFSDYDFFCLVDQKYTSSEIYDEILKILINVKSHVELYFTELKVEMKDKQKIRFYKDDYLQKDKFEKIDSTKIDFIKIDFVSRTNNKFMDVSCVYKFDHSKYNKKKSLKEDIKELTKEKQYYKVLKRMYKIYELNNNTNEMAKLAKYFNSDIGKQYQLMNNLKSIKSLIDNDYMDVLTKKKIRINLHEEGLPYNTIENIDDVIKKLDHNINNTTKQIFNF